MPKFALTVKMELENIATVKWAENNQWCFVVRNQDESETCEAYVCKEDVFDLQNSRGTAHFIKKWPGEQQQSYLKLIDVKNITGAKELSVSSEDVVLLAVEARGMEPVEWQTKNDFTVISNGGSIFEDVDIEDGVWADYDADHDCPVSIQDLEYSRTAC